MRNNIFLPEWSIKPVLSFYKFKIKNTKRVYQFITRLPLAHVELNDINIFREMSEVAPDAFFEAEITGCTDYTEQSLKAVLMNRRLKITQTYEENDEVPEAYLEYIIEKLPYRDFLKFFKLSSDDLDEDLYEDMMNDIATETWDEESLFDMEYDDFIGTLEAFDVETELEKEDYDAAVEAIRELNIESGKSFAEGYQGGSETTLLYDPIVKAYIWNSESDNVNDFLINELLGVQWERIKNLYCMKLGWQTLGE